MDKHPENCKVCKYDQDEIDWSLSNVAISAIVDCSEASVRRHKKWVEANGFGLGSTTYTALGHEFPDTGVPGIWRPRRHWETAAGETLNSFEFVPDRTGAETEVHIDDARIDSLIRDWPFAKWDSFEVEDDLAFIADPQLGKAHEQGGGTDQTIARTLASVEQVAKRWEILRPRNGYVCDLGDIIENIFSTPQQAGTNDRELPKQIEDAVSLYMNILGRLMPLVETLHHATVTSNHGEARSAMKINPYGSENDWGLMIQRIIKGKCEDRGWDVVFHRPSLNEDTTVLTMSDGTEVALNHGHHSGTPQKMKAWVTGQIVGRRPGWNARVWVHGHFHHPEHFPVGNGVTVFGTPALDGGSAWFTRKTGESSPPGIACISMVKGKWLNYSIL